MQEDINIWQMGQVSRFLFSNLKDNFRYKNAKFPAFHLYLGGLFGDLCVDQ
jgi:hypothetical protein